MDIFKIIFYVLLGLFVVAVNIMALFGEKDKNLDLDLY